MSFIGLRVPHETARLLSQIEVPGERQDLAHSHITLLHLGDRIPIDVLAKAVKAAYEVASTTRPFTVSTSLVSHFPSEDKIPIICRVDSAELHNLWAALKRAFDAAGIEYSKKFPVFKPHTTLSYSGTPVEDIQIPTIEWGAHEMVLWGGDKGDERLTVTFPFGLFQKEAVWRSLIRLAMARQATFVGPYFWEGRKSEVGYQDKPGPNGQSCLGCQFFRPPPTSAIQAMGEPTTQPPTCSKWWFSVQPSGWCPSWTADTLQARIARRYAAQEVIDDEQLNELDPEKKQHWKGYSYRMIHEVWTKEDLEVGDTANRRQEVSEPFKTLEALVRHVDQGKWATWLDPRQGMIEGKDKKDRKGGVTRTDLVIERKDGKALNSEEQDYITSRLRLRK